MLYFIICFVLFCCCFLSCSSIIFFFKQKAAYELRIRDWSSDVCSSDLRRISVAHTATEMISQCFTGHKALRGVKRKTDASMMGREERKSVAEGKSVSGRVDHGGHRIIKKKSIE